MPVRLALKVDADTDRGTRVGVPSLAADCREFGAAACFLFSLGPDQTGRAITRVLRPGFFSKVSRTSVVQIYGLRTLLNGTLLPSPHIGRRNTGAMRAVRGAGFEVGIHCSNHYRWQDHLHRMDLAAVRAEFAAARAEFTRVFGGEARTAGAPGWQSTSLSREVYDEAGLLYSSDTRGYGPFFPRIDGTVFRTLEIPSTLPTLDELMGRPQFPDSAIAGHLVSLLRPDRLNVFTLHAEIEGMGRRGIFREFLAACRASGVEFVRLEDEARRILSDRAAVPVCDQLMAPIDGRSGLVATQAQAAAQAA
jgi:undecaprenyl phosphate-alpha-L-ara4FN deformylase